MPLPLEAYCSCTHVGTKAKLKRRKAQTGHGMERGVSGKENREKVLILFQRYGYTPIHIMNEGDIYM